MPTLEHEYRKMSIEIGQEVLVKWLDAKMWGAGWFSEEQVETMELPLIESRGQVQRVTDDMLLLRQSSTEDNNDSGNLVGIPRGCIKEIKEL